MKSVMVSIQPKICENLANGKLKFVCKKSAPKEVPFKAYIYETFDRKYNETGICWDNSKQIFEHACKKVLGEFICDRVDKLQRLYNGHRLFNWHITDLKIYDKPRELSEFTSPSKAKTCVGYCLNGICSNLGYEELCGAIKRCEYKKLTRSPKIYQYVEEL